MGTERRSERFDVGGFSPTARDPWETGRAVSTGKLNDERFQDLVRAVNHCVRELGRKWHVDECDVVCECRNLDCTELMKLGASDYEAARAHPAHFIVLPGHDQPAVERVVEQHDRYAIVLRRTGAPRERLGRRRHLSRATGSSRLWRR
ncbi:MAG: hypothetical protein ACXVFE_14855 [Gaiellaceae bacterium]